MSLLVAFHERLFHTCQVHTCPKSFPKGMQRIAQERRQKTIFGVRVFLFHLLASLLPIFLPWPSLNSYRFPPHSVHFLFYYLYLLHFSACCQPGHTTLYLFSLFVSSLTFGYYFVFLVRSSLLCFLVSDSSLNRGQPGHTVRLVPSLPSLPASAIFSSSFPLSFPSLLFLFFCLLCYIVLAQCGYTQSGNTLRPTSGR